MHVRNLLIGPLLLFTPLSLPAIAQNPEAAQNPEMKVYKTRTCGCCSLWVNHIKANGFTVTTEDVSNITEIKKDFGIPVKLQSCHTGVVGDYVIEGHVPAADIHRLLKERPEAIGLTVPGMPMGSPGMDGPWSDSYTVYLFRKDGTTEIFSKYKGTR
jgi:hypothetical protein